MLDRDKVVASLRDFADFLEDNNEVPVPNMFDSFPVTAWHSLSREELGTVAKLAARFGMQVDKDYSGESFSLKIGDKEGVRFSCYVNREVVCRRVDTGETKTVKVYPDDIPTVEKEVPVYEWVCDDPLLATKKDENGSGTA